MPKKTTKVLILKTTAGVGKEGEIKEVSLGQARNMLIPRGIAKEVSSDAKSEKADPRAGIHEKRKDIQEAVHDTHLVCSVEAHGSRITGHFDGADVAKVIKEKLHVKVLPEMIRFDDVKHPKKLGNYTFHVDIADDTYIKASIEITSK